MTADKMTAVQYQCFYKIFVFTSYQVMFLKLPMQTLFKNVDFMFCTYRTKSNHEKFLHISGDPVHQ